jgi:hypothetical protein
MNGKLVAVSDFVEDDGAYRFESTGWHLMQSDCRCFGRPMTSSNPSAVPSESVFVIQAQLYVAAHGLIAGHAGWLDLALAIIRGSLVFGECSLPLRAPDDDEKREQEHGYGGRSVFKAACFMNGDHDR